MAAAAANEILNEASMATLEEVRDMGQASLREASMTGAKRISEELLDSI